ncbi:Uncharacterised protein [Streptococcus gallolyticus]|uniref:Uncharacterized protein n=1 Tax=Streptococcus gallolyticus TaxID=315405 RepID=A0AA94M142_9STRE|nr:hypothetical protein [Streptococcus gallolyticus]AQP41326.1 hypothetical protein BTR42_01635 [Streptococcus gallolyticus subsp. gallolyticus DSM 16831]SQG78608.1 Uncharacterised protein [Streptococcus gallolyticus]
MTTFLDESVQRFREKLGFYIASQKNITLDSGTMSRIRHGKVRKNGKTFLTASVIFDLKQCLKINSNRLFFFPNDIFLETFIYELLRIMIHEEKFQDDSIVKKFKINVDEYFNNQYQLVNINLKAKFEQFFADKKNDMLFSFKNLTKEIDDIDNLDSNKVENLIIKWVAYYLNSL